MARGICRIRFENSGCPGWNGDIRYPSLARLQIACRALGDFGLPDGTAATAVLPDGREMPAAELAAMSYDDAFAAMSRQEGPQ